MKKKLFISILLILYLPAFLLAQPRVVDNAGLLSNTEKTDLERRIADIASRYSFDLVIVTENSTGGIEPMDYADDFFDYNGYGLGEDRDGCLFLQVTATRDYWVSTSGRGINILNNTAFAKLESDILNFLTNDDPAGAYHAFVNAWEEFLVLDAKGRSYNFFHRWNAVLILIAWVVSFLIGFIVVQSWKAQMNTALPKKEAAPYVVPGSLVFTVQQERFLYSTVTKTERPQASSSSSSGGGGRHTSSSGRSHGGGGGKY
jgi:uncharacterized protein